MHQVEDKLKILRGVIGVKAHFHLSVDNLRREHRGLAEHCHLSFAVFKNSTLPESNQILPGGFALKAQAVSGISA